MVVKSDLPKTTCTNYGTLTNPKCNSEWRLENELRKGRNQGRKEERMVGKRKEGRGKKERRKEKRQKLTVSF